MDYKKLIQKDRLEEALKLALKDPKFTDHEDTLLILSSSLERIARARIMSIAGETEKIDYNKARISFLNIINIVGNSQTPEEKQEKTQKETTTMKGYGTTFAEICENIQKAYIANPNSAELNATVEFLSTFLNGCKNLEFSMNPEDIARSVINTLRKVANSLTDPEAIKKQFDAVLASDNLNEVKKFLPLLAGYKVDITNADALRQGGAPVKHLLFAELRRIYVELYNK